MEILKLICALFLLKVSSAVNYVQNGEFQNPVNTMGLQTVNNGSGYMPFWDGHFDVCTIAYRGYGLGNGQYIDLATLQNGYLTQNVTLPFNGTYALTYRRRYDHSNYLDFHMQIDWNGAIVASIIPTTENLVTDNISLIGMVGKNKLKFEEIGLGGVQYLGTFIDGVSIELVTVSPSPNITNITNQTVNGTNQTQNITNNGTSTNNATNNTVQNSSSTGNATNNSTNNTANNGTNNQANNGTNTQVNNGTNNQIDDKPNQETNDDELDILLQVLKKIHSLPASTLNGFKILAVFIDDLWMYSYDNRTYNGTIATVFNTIQEVQNVKWSLMNFAQSLNFTEQSLPLSNYTTYTKQKHLDIEGLDGLMARNLFKFYVYSVPQFLVYCLVMYAIFRCLFNYEISVFFRKFCFGFALLQMLFQNNVAYFTYLAFNNFQMSFFFTFNDKLSMAIMILLYGFFLIYIIAFFMLAHYKYGKLACYFIHQLYRTFPSVVYLTLKVTMRGFLKGVIHSVLHSYYGWEMLCLTLVEVLIITAGIYSQIKYHVYLTKTHFIIYMLYHFNFILINGLLYVEEIGKDTNLELQRLANDLQTIILYIHCVYMGILSILSFIPFNLIKTQPDTFGLEDDDFKVKINKLFILTDEKKKQLNIDNKKKGKIKYKGNNQKIASFRRNPSRKQNSERKNDKSSKEKGKKQAKNMKNQKKKFEQINDKIKTQKQLFRKSQQKKNKNKKPKQQKGTSTLFRTNTLQVNYK